MDEGGGGSLCSIDGQAAPLEACQDAVGGGGNTDKSSAPWWPGSKKAYLHSLVWNAASTKLNSANSLLDALAGPNVLTTPECESDLAGIQKQMGLTIQDIATAVDDAGLIDGTTTANLDRDLYVPGSSDYQLAGLVTIAQVLNSPTTGTRAITGLPGSALAGNIYFNPSFVNNHSVGYNAALLLHEGIHLLGFLDPAFMGALDFNPNDGITDKGTALLAKDCFGVLN
jgi:hypothetical protein